jgi:hypothetical protein
MDILISTPTIMLDIKKLITNKFNTNQMSKNGNVFSFLHGLDNKYDLQIDLIFTKEKYFDSSLDLPNNYVVISNRYNLEHGQEPIGYFDIQCLYDMFVHLTESGYTVIYKRPNNTEFATDPNELLNLNITANVSGIGNITDYQLASMFDNVYLMDDIIKSIPTNSYNEAQLKIYARSSGFISMGGGSSILCSYFGKPVVIYVNTSGDIRPGYFEGDSYFKKLSNAAIHPIIDKKDDIIARGYRDYLPLHTKIQTVFPRKD